MTLYLLSLVLPVGQELLGCEVAQGLVGGGVVVGAGGLWWLVYEVWVWLRTIWYGYRGIRARLVTLKRTYRHGKDFLAL